MLAVSGRAVLVVGSGRVFCVVVCGEVLRES